MDNSWKNVEWISKIIKESRTRKEVLEKLNKSVSTAMYKRLKKFEQDSNIDVTHFSPYQTMHRYDAFVGRRKWRNEEIFCENSPVTTQSIKKRILSDKLIDYVCEGCGNEGIWDEKPLHLQLEHKDGISNNHTLQNLCFLCPNCHSQTETYCGRNKPKTKQSLEGHISLIKNEARLRNQPLVEKILSSDVDFSRYGWVKQAAQLIEKNPQKIKEWMMLYMPDFYINNCYHRNKGGNM